SEPPAVVDLLVHGGRVSRAGAAATALDLAARGFIDVDEITSSLTLVHARRTPAPEQLLPFESRVIEALEQHEVGGVVPADACDLGPEALSWRWWRAFGRDVGDEAARHGLVTSGSALSRLWLGLLALLAIPAWMLIVGTGGTGSTGSNDLGSWLAVLSLLIPG